MQQQNIKLSISFILKIFFTASVYLQMEIGEIFALKIKNFTFF
jgi:hypothetical protein